MEDFLKQLNIIKLKYEMLYENKENFNIFSVLHKDNDERRLHSRFISSLLTTDGSHGKNRLFLDFFFSVVKASTENFKNIEVYPEEWDKKENNNIDILIIDRTTKFAIIIENKIYAGDSNNSNGGQLERYFIHVRDAEKIPENNISTFYLTLDGHEPSDDSLGSFKNLENINGNCISYPIEILEWLKKCLTVTTEEPFIRESILQYITLIEKMTGNQTDIKQRLEIKTIIGKNSDNMNSTKMLIDNFKHVKWHTVRDFWDNLRDKLVENGFKVISTPNDQNITDMTHYESYRKGQKNKQDSGIYFELLKGIRFCLWNEAGEALYFGLEQNEKINDSLKEQIESIVESESDFDKNEYYYFWKDFFEKDDEHIYLTDFSYQATFDLIDSNKQLIVIQKMVDEIETFKERIKDYNKM